MVATFAAALFVHEAPYPFDRAVEQLSILWANALGIARPVSRSAERAAIGPG